MSTLGRWLVGILNAHIERHNVVAAEPGPDSPLARFYIGQLDAEDDEPGGITPFQLGGVTVEEAAQRLRDNLDLIAAEMTRPPTGRYEAASGQLSVGQIEETWRRAGTALGLPPTVRPCWACGDAVGFHAAHDCDTHFDTTGGAARRVPAPTPSRLTVLGDEDISPASTWRRQ